jgi:soluble lytic murein transglycosylase-like protein
MVSVPLSSKTKEVLQRYTPSYRTWSSAKTPTQAQLNEIKTASANAEFNIAMGTAIIRWLLEAYSKEGDSPLNKVMVSYNMGYYGAKNKIKGNMTSQQMLAVKGLGIESKSYLLKMLGRYGFLDLLFNNGTA